MIEPKDIPKEFVSYIVENPQEDGPYGARGIGEQTMLGVPAAIGNAIFNAISVRISEIPATPERVWQAIQNKIQEELE